MELAGRSDTGSNSMRHVFIFSYGCCWACRPPTGGQANREQSCHSRWHSAPEHKPSELPYSYQMYFVLEEISPYVVAILI